MVHFFAVHARAYTLISPAGYRVIWGALLWPMLGLALGRDPRQTIKRSVKLVGIVYNVPVVLARQAYRKQNSLISRTWG